MWAILRHHKPPGANTSIFDMFVTLCTDCVKKLEAKRAAGRSGISGHGRTCRRFDPAEVTAQLAA